MSLLIRLWTQLPRRQTSQTASMYAFLIFVGAVYGIQLLFVWLVDTLFYRSKITNKGADGELLSETKVQDIG